MKKPLVLTILDGFGLNASDYGNAIKSASTPNLSRLFKECPNTSIKCSGMEVGLPEGQMGNSEVGHTNIGAGRTVYQELTRITKSIIDGDFFSNPALLEAINNCKKNNSALHLMGLVSDGGVHSHNTHLYALLRLAKMHDLTNVFVHCFLDGRDVPPNSGRGFLIGLEEKLIEIGVGKIATIMGRYYAMDRDTRWERVQKAYIAMSYGEGPFVSNPIRAIESSYVAKVMDEFVLPTVCTNNAQIKNKDSVIFFNFRPDRAREITRAFVDPAFDGFPRKDGLLDLVFVCMTEYDATMPNVKIAYLPRPLTHTFGEYISEKGLTQLRIAETTKYAHVTFFFNGGEELIFKGEDRILIPTPNVATFDLKPEMSAYQVCDAVCERILSGYYDVIVLNFANCDMVGHTGIMDAAIKAVEVVDTCVGRVVVATQKMDGVCLITADHGNADQMKEPDGSPFTAHTTNPVPFIVVGFPCKLQDGGKLADIAPTMLHILKLPKPKEMDGNSLIK
jgi:2,3-bisphosphoglycerate-independent phosphoglycerate mutase